MGNSCIQRTHPETYSAVITMNFEDMQQEVEGKWRQRRKSQKEQKPSEVQLLLGQKGIVAGAVAFPHQTTGSESDDYEYYWKDASFVSTSDEEAYSQVRFEGLPSEVSVSSVDETLDQGPAEIEQFREALDETGFVDALTKDDAFWGIDADLLTGCAMPDIPDFTYVLPTEDDDARDATAVYFDMESTTMEQIDAISALEEDDTSLQSVTESHGIKIVINSPDVGHEVEQELVTETLEVSYDAADGHNPLTSESHNFSPEAVPLVSESAIKIQLLNNIAENLAIATDYSVSEIDYEYVAEDNVQDALTGGVPFMTTGPSVNMDLLQYELLKNIVESIADITKPDSQEMTNEADQASYHDTGSDSCEEESTYTSSIRADMKVFLNQFLSNSTQDVEFTSRPDSSIFTDERNYVLKSAMCSTSEATVADLPELSSTELQVKEDVIKGFTKMAYREAARLSNQKNYLNFVADDTSDHLTNEMPSIKELNYHLLRKIARCIVIAAHSHSTTLTNFPKTVRKTETSLGTRMSYPLSAIHLNVTGYRILRNIAEGAADAMFSKLLVLSYVPCDCDDSDTSETSRDVPNSKDAMKVVLSFDKLDLLNKLRKTIAEVVGSRTEKTSWNLASFPEDSIETEAGENSLDAVANMASEKSYLKFKQKVKTAEALASSVLPSIPKQYPNRGVSFLTKLPGRDSLPLIDSPELEDSCQFPYSLGEINSPDALTKSPTRTSFLDIRLEKPSKDCVTNVSQDIHQIYSSSDGSINMFTDSCSSETQMQLTDKSSLTLSDASILAEDSEGCHHSRVISHLSIRLNKPTKCIGRWTVRDNSVLSTAPGSILQEDLNLQTVDNSHEIRDSVVDVETVDNFHEIRDSVVNVETVDNSHEIRDSVVDVETVDNSHETRDSVVDVASLISNFEMRFKKPDHGIVRGTMPVSSVLTKGGRGCYNSQTSDTEADMSSELNSIEFRRQIKISSTKSLPVQGSAWANVSEDSQNPKRIVATLVNVKALQMAIDKKIADGAADPVGSNAWNLRNEKPKMLTTKHIRHESKAFDACDGT